jgi:hypothetical protein
MWCLPQAGTCHCWKPALSGMLFHLDNRVWSADPRHQWERVLTQGVHLAPEDPDFMEQLGLCAGGGVDGCSCVDITVATISIGKQT